MQLCLVIQKCEASIVLPIQSYVVQNAEISDTLGFVLDKCVYIYKREFKIFYKKIKCAWYYDRRIFFLPVNIIVYDFFRIYMNCR